LEKRFDFPYKITNISKNQSPTQLICPFPVLSRAVFIIQCYKTPLEAPYETHKIHFLKCTLHNRSACVLRPQINYGSELSCSELCSVHRRFKRRYSWLTRTMLQNIHSHKIFIEFFAANEKQTEQRQLSSRNVA